eukprot:Platyproteum_vivax@DN730_c0_g1_i1.p1
MLSKIFFSVIFLACFAYFLIIFLVYNEPNTDISSLSEVDYCPDCSVEDQQLSFNKTYAKILEHTYLNSQRPLVVCGVFSYVEKNEVNTTVYPSLGISQEELLSSLPQTPEFLRRMSIRETWMTYPEVYHPTLRPHGNMVVMFVIGGHDSRIPNTLRQEAVFFKDIAFVDSPRDTVRGGKINWWFFWARKHFPDATLYAKSDNEAFVRVPQFVQYLEEVVGTSDTEYLFLGEGANNYGFWCKNEVPCPKQKHHIVWKRGWMIVVGPKLIDTLEEAVQSNSIPYSLQTCMHAFGDVLFAIVLDYIGLMPPLMVEVGTKRKFFDLAYTILGDQCLERVMNNRLVLHFEKGRDEVPAANHLLFHYVYPAPTGELDLSNEAGLDQLTALLVPHCLLPLTNVQEALATRNQTAVLREWQCRSYKVGVSRCQPIQLQTQKPNKDLGQKKPTSVGNFLGG